MGDSSAEPPVSPYARDTAPGPHPGERATCELCQRTRRCFEAYGFVACEGCQHELLPEGGVL
uniref:Uncharacterized protein FLAS10H9.35 n=1 Tax=uncultured haloarchaeon FLAS10H9 TaxID=447098 RepID=A7U0W3_9EURY|nr:hypothetical protein [uncultured haloarchaeon FLAS10H9]